ncbi:MAG: hypothetical protein JXA67_20080 [Micromonosporaceae bacterium]|nr:hypothetical protein [Micromonosporaceae bacterium]
MTDLASPSSAHMLSSGISRRQLLSLAGLVLGTGIVELAGPAPAAFADPGTGADQFTLEPIADHPVNVLDSGTAAVAQYPRQLAVRIANSGVELPAGSRLTITFDSQLYVPVESPVVTIGNAPHPTSSTLSKSAETGLTTCAITLDNALPPLAAGREAAIALVATAHPLRYPHDLVRRLADPTAEVGATAKSPRASCGMRRQRSATGSGSGRPWGMELSGVWTKHSWGPGNELCYYYPTQITVRAVGPGRATVPAAFTIALDAQVVTAVTVTSLRLNNRPYQGSARQTAISTSGAAHLSQWLLPMSLKAGDVIDIGLAATLTTPDGALPTIKHPVVTLSSTTPDQVQRLTGQTTLTRLDSVWTTAPAG